MDAPALHPRLKDTLEAFRAGGVFPSDEEIVWLAALRHPCDHPDDGSIPWIMGAPFMYAGIAWYPLHELADDWWTRAFKLLDGNKRDQVLVYLFAHAHSAPGDATVRMLMDTESIRRAVNEWASKLPLHEAQHDPLCDRLRELDGYRNEVPDPDEKPSQKTGEAKSKSAVFAGLMCKAFPGVSPEYWLTGIAKVDAIDMISGVNSECFADSPKRSAAIANYLKAVKWVWVNHNG